MDIKTIDLELLKTMPLPDWSDDATKSTRGKLLLIAGSRRIPGAAVLAARAALRAGCGSVRVAAPASVALHIGIAVPELMVVPLPETESGTIAESAKALVAEQCKICNAIVLGPGLDEHPETDRFACDVVTNAPLPLVVDAQAISALGPKFEWKKTPKNALRVLTPHQREFEALSGGDVGDEKEGRAEIATKWASEKNAILSLKGAPSLVAAPDGAIFEQEGLTRALGTAGSGDVLAGVIGSLLAQGMDATQATIWGVHLHAEAGRAVSKDGPEDGVMARDFIETLPGVQKYLRRSTGEKKRGSFGLRPGM